MLKNYFKGFNAAILSLGAAIFALTSLPAVTWAADSSANNLVIEEIIVTARKKEESIQDTPLAVTAITGELREGSVRRLEDIQAFAPNLFINRTPGIASGAAITIRGVASLESDKSFEPSIGVVMDGMFLGTSSGVLLDNFDIERIEVLRGPQGTLFGKNTTGGILNVIRSPVSLNEMGADISLTGGSFGRQDIKAVAQIPLIEDTLGLKLFGASIQHDGHVRNTTLNTDVGGDDKTNYGFTVLWEPNDDFDLKVHHEIMEDNSEQGAYTNRNVVGELACTITQIGFDPANGCEKDANDGPDTTESDGSNFSNNDYETTIVTANFNTEAFLYTYIYSLRDMDEQNMQDFDGAPAHLLRMNFFNDWEQTSHEFRVTSQFSDTVQFIAGFYDWEADFEQRWDVYDLFYQLSRLGVPPWGAGRQGVEGYSDVFPWEDDVAGNNGQSQLTTSTAVFFSADWFVAENWTVTAGFRWTEEEKDFVGGASAPGYYPLRGEPWPGIFNPYEAKAKWTETTPKLGLRYQPSDDAMFYASYSEGFKSGGFFARQANYLIDPSYEPEYVKNYEFGWKTTLQDGRMIFNGAIFRSDYDDKQESILIPVDLSNVATVVRNASSLEMTGLELEVMYQVTQAWNVMATYGYLDSEYADYLADLTGDNIITDNSALVPRNTPKNTFGLTTSYTAKVGNGDLKARISYRHRSDMETNSSNNPLGTLDSISNVNATVSYTIDNYGVSLWGRNITDQREERWATIGGLTSRGWWNEPATYGVTVSASF
ncbi:MAG: TonB-dependent receptor [Pseudomonadales bacterium]|nr:TonB-dependent receptor [Pseudomonadales bacterium]